MKKLCCICMSIFLLALSACSANDTSNIVSEQDYLINEMVVSGDFDRKFTSIDLLGKSASTLPKTSAYQVDEDRLLIAQEHESSDSNYDIDTLFCLYDLKDDKIVKQLQITGAYHCIMVRGNKVLIKSSSEFYVLDFDLQQVREKIALPEVVLSNLCADCYTCPIYDVSDDLRYLLYSCAENGMYLYDFESGENRQVFAGKSFPYHYEADINFWRTPDRMFFLPGKQQFAVAAINQQINKQGLWVFDFAGRLQGFISDEEFGDVADIASWDNPELLPQPFTKTNRYTADGNAFSQTYVHKVDFQTQTVDDWRKVECPADSIIQAFNKKYFAYIEQHFNNGSTLNEIMLVDYDTLTSQSVLQAKDVLLELAGITDDGRVLFVCAPDIDSEYFADDLFIIGLTDTIE